MPFHGLVPGEEPVVFSCPRCKHILSADATQSERCGEILPAGKGAAAASLPPPSVDS